MCPTTGSEPRLDVVAQAQLPTKFGNFDIHVFRWASGDSVSSCAYGLSPDHVALSMGELTRAEEVLVRVHSECLTSEAFGSLRSDGKRQLEAAQQRIAEEGRGIVLYLRQEGRGIGLANTARAYELQDAGHDTVDANRSLGLPDDARDYGAAAAMLLHLGVASIRLMTNNPAKVDALCQLGTVVSGREPVIVSTNEHSAGYLETKHARMGHDLPIASSAAAAK